MSQLILHPKDAHWLDEHHSVEALLLKLEFIQNKKVQDKYLTGEKFLNLLTFMGCAPNIQIDFDSTNPNSAFCSVKMAYSVAYKDVGTQNCLEHYACDPLLLVRDNIRPPKCPFCRKGVAQWKNYQQNQTFDCQHCDKTIQLETLNWKQQGGYAKTMIVIDNIYNQEAIPTDLLLKELKNNTNTEWLYFYHL